jgi:head-tail adaptor
MLLEQCKAALQQALELAVLRRRNQRRFQRSSNEQVVSELILRIRLAKGCASQFRKILRVFGARARNP